MKSASWDTALSTVNVVLGNAYELYDDGRSSTTTWKTAAKTDEIGDGAALLAGAAGVDYDYQRGDTWAFYTEHHRHRGEAPWFEYTEVGGTEWTWGHMHRCFDIGLV